jgi:hypothetical protein
MLCIQPNKRIKKMKKIIVNQGGVTEMLPQAIGDDNLYKNI